MDLEKLGIMTSLRLYVPALKLSGNAMEKYIMIPMNEGLAVCFWKVSFLNTVKCILGWKKSLL